MAGRVHKVDAGAAGSLQDVFDAAAAGDVVSLGPGEYRGPFAVRRSLSVVGREGGREGRPALVGGAVDRVLSLEGHDLSVSLSGLTIRGGVAGLGAGVGLMGSGDVEVTGCVFEDNRAGDVGGGAFFASAGQIHFRDCLFRRNHGRRGGALLLSDVALVSATNCLFQGNTAQRGGAVRLEGRAVFAALHATFADDRVEAGEERAGGGTFDLAGARDGRPQLRLANSLVLAGSGSLADERGAPGRVVVAWSVVPPDWQDAAAGLDVEGRSIFAVALRGEQGGLPTVAKGGPGAGGADWTLTVLGDALLDLTGAHRLMDERIDVGAIDATE